MPPTCHSIPFYFCHAAIKHAQDSKAQRCTYSCPKILLTLVTIAKLRTKPMVAWMEVLNNVKYAEAGKELKK